MNSSQVILANSILQALLQDIDLEKPFRGEKVLVRFVWENYLKDWLTMLYAY